jgi:hypothetical protein
LIEPFSLPANQLLELFRLSAAAEHQVKGVSPFCTPQTWVSFSAILTFVTNFGSGSLQ